MTQHQDNAAEVSTPTPIAAPPALGIDYACYEQYLAESGWNDAQKKAFLDTLWSIIVAFVDLGFGVHPIQQVGGQPGDPMRIVAQNALDMLEPSGTTRDGGGRDTAVSAEKSNKHKED